jgi:hypothetical protein
MPMYLVRRVPLLLIETIIAAVTGLMRRSMGTVQSDLKPFRGESITCINLDINRPDLVDSFVAWPPCLPLQCQ